MVLTGGGANHETRRADVMIAGIDEMLSKGISFSLYMTHGGTKLGPLGRLQLSGLCARRDIV